MFLLVSTRIAITSASAAMRRVQSVVQQARGTVRRATMAATSWTVAALTVVRRVTMRWTWTERVCDATPAVDTCTGKEYSNFWVWNFICGHFLCNIEANSPLLSEDLEKN